MSYWGNKVEQGSWIRVLLVGAVAGAVVVGLVWWGTWWSSSGDPEQRRAEVHTHQAADGPALVTTRASEATSELALCQSVHDEQSAPLRTAAHSLHQWEVHVGAMDKLVAGEITLDQAWKFWNQTRVGAHARLHDYATARDHYGRRIFRCPKPGDAVEARPELDECHRAVAARGRTLRLATVALSRWEQHVHHMDMLRSGAMTAQQATALWLQNWRDGEREIHAYRTARRRADGLSC